MANQRVAEIAGAGMAGLATAAALARDGWKVTVHERDPSLRELGAGIAIWPNGVLAVDRAGALEEASADADRNASWELRDHRNRPIQDGWMPSHREKGGGYLVMRPALHQALRNSAVRHGVEIRLDSAAVGATRDGELHLSNGEVRTADLVVGADGVFSPVRESLGLTEEKRQLRDGGARHLIPRRASDISDRQLERWDGGRRMGIVPCSSEHVYVYLCCPADDVEGRDQQNTLEPWIQSFPEQADYLKRIPLLEPWRPFYVVKTTSWSSGRAAIVGDAASAMPPNLGQAACLGMSNGVSLASALRISPSVTEALRLWEASERPITDHAQRYSVWYGAVGTSWPRSLQGVRSLLLRGAVKLPAWQKHVTKAVEHVPGQEFGALSGGGGR